MRKPKPPQFGYIYIFGHFISTDPIGYFLARLPNKKYIHSWDSFYRCKLKMPYFFYKLENRRFRELEEARRKL